MTLSTLRQPESTNDLRLLRRPDILPTKLAVVRSTCSVPGCERPVFCKKRCNSCDRFYRRNGYDRPYGLIQEQRDRDAVGIRP